MIDGVTLKVQGRHYYDFTVHHIHIVRPRNVLEVPKFGLKTGTILFLEGPEINNAESIRSLIDTHLEAKFGVSFDSLQKKFTVVTDGATVMERVAGCSVSRRLAPLEEKWMRCFAHVLSNLLKFAMNNCTSDGVLVKIADDFRLLKKLLNTLSAMGGA